MADVIVTPIVETILNGLIDFLKDETLSIFNVKDELERMEGMMQKIMLIIKDAEKQSFDDERSRSRMIKLKDIAYDIDDVIDDCKVKALTLASTSSGHSHYKSFSRLKNLPFSYKIGKRIKKINAKLEEIAEENKQEYVIAPNFRDEQQSNNAERIISKTTRLVATDDLVGCAEEDAKKLTKQMSEENESGGNTRVNLAVVGMGGIGKTTLAQKIYDNVEKSGQFQKTIWICVSKDFKVEDLLKEIVRKAGGNYGNGESLDELTYALVKAVRDKRFFLVLDDVWEAYIWNNVLRVPLKSGANGSKVLITTREADIAKQMSALYFHHVKPLSIEEGWYLLRNNVFETENEMNSSEHLEDVGVRIIEKCGRLPLAIKAVAGILKTKDKQRGEWEEIISNEAWTQNIFEKDDKIMKVLYLSYEHLPYQLKQCFVYCSLFPEDFIFHKEELVPFWIAEGLLGDKVTTKSGENLFKELVNRNLLQESFGDGHKLHDLLRSLGQRLGEGEYFCGNLKHLDKSVRHLYLRNENSLIDDHLQRLDKKLRTFISCDSFELKVIPKSVFQKLKYLRVLSLRYTEIDVIPDSIKCLLHLRYLDLSYSNFTIIPESISYLKSLQFLFVKGISLKKFPKSITSLQNLMLLDNRGSLNPIEMPKGLGRLKKLEKLIFKVGENENEAKLGEIRSLNLLRHLEIYNLQQNQSLEEARSVELERKTHLQYLRLDWTHKENVSDEDGDRVTEAFEDSDRVTEVSEDSDRVTEVFEELRPSSSLSDLHIQNFYGRNLPTWMSCSNDVSLNNLVHLKIEGCKHCQQLPGFGELPQLKVLEISEASSIQKIGREFLGRGDRSTSTEFSVRPFAKLERMELWGFSELKEWHWDGVEDDEDGGTTTPFPCLKYLYISGCPKLKSLPGFGELPQLEVLEISYASSIKKVKPDFLGTGGKSTSIGFSVHPFAKLVEMRLEDFLELKELHWDGAEDDEDGGSTIPFPCLKDFTIWRCPKLKSLPGFGELPQLEVLVISRASIIQKIGCEFLGRGDKSTSTGFSARPFAKLVKMTLSGFSELKEWHWDGTEDDEDGGTMTPFPCLQYLTIEECPKLKSLPEGLQHATSLVELKLYENKDLERIPRLPTLKNLFIRGCSSMRHVGNLNSLEIVQLDDMELGAIPPWLSNAFPSMSSFQHLYIETGEVQLLRKLCYVDLDWPLVKDVPRVDVTYKSRGDYRVHYTKSPFYIEANLPEYSGLIRCSSPTEFSRMKGLITSQASSSTS